MGGKVKNPITAEIRFFDLSFRCLLPQLDEILGGGHAEHRSDSFHLPGRVFQACQISPSSLIIAPQTWDYGVGLSRALVVTLSARPSTRDERHANVATPSVWRPDLQSRRGRYVASGLRFTEVSDRGERRGAARSWFL